jgi:hypothetical protein
MIFTIDNNSPAVIRFVPTQPVSHALHYLKDKYYTCVRFQNQKTACPICDMRNNLYTDANNAPTDKNKRECNEFARALRPIEKHYLAIIDRAQPEQGVQILAASKWLYEIILKGWLTHPCRPPEPKWYQFWTRLENWWTGYRRPNTALDQLEGVDFILRREMKRAGAHSFADYSTSTYATTCSPLHPDKQQREAWVREAEETLKGIQFPASTELTTTHTI